MLDYRHDGYFAVGPADDYVFQAGDICGYNVIIASFPAGQEYGTSAADALASQVKTFFPNLYLGLLVGVAAGLPDLTQHPERDIRLGDVLVALSVDDKPAVIPYDLGKQRPNDDFTLLRSGNVLSNTKTVRRSAIGTLKAEEPHSTKSFLPYYHAIEHMQHATGTLVDPGQEHDHYVVGGKPVQRRTRPSSQRTRVWYGAMGSGDTLMKDSGRRNDLRERHGILGSEMEAAGIMNHIPVAVIRGVCDYGDEYKNKDWQPYAAAMAATYANAVLQRIPPRPVTMSNPSPKVSLSIVSGEGRNGVEVPQASGQSTLTRLIQRIITSPITDSVNPLIDILRRYLQTAMFIPRSLSRSIVICDFLRRDLHFKLPLDWYDFRVILLPHFDTRERHGFEKIRNEEFLIIHCDRSEKRFKRIGPSMDESSTCSPHVRHMFATCSPSPIS